MLHVLLLRIAVPIKRLKRQGLAVLIKLFSEAESAVCAVVKSSDDAVAVIVKVRVLWVHVCRSLIEKRAVYLCVVLSHYEGTDGDTNNESDDYCEGSLHAPN